MNAGLVRQTAVVLMERLKVFVGTLSVFGHTDVSF